MLRNSNLFFNTYKMKRYLGSPFWGVFAKSDTVKQNIENKIVKNIMNNVMDVISIHKKLVLFGQPCCILKYM